MPRRFEEEFNDSNGEPQYPDDAYDRPDRRVKREMNWLDQQFANTGILALVLFGLCCGEISLIFGILGVIICKDPVARKNATIVLCISVVRFVIAIIYVIVTVTAQQQAPGPF